MRSRRLPVLAWCLVMGCLLVSVGCAGKRPPRLPEAARDEDLATRTALRASLAGNERAVMELARDRAAFEESEAVSRTSPIAGDIAALAAATERPLPDHRETRALLGEFEDSDREARVMERLLRRIEPSQRFRQARIERLYSHRIGVADSVMRAAYGMLTLNWWQFVSLPFEGLEYLAVGRPYVDPLQRRELAAAQQMEEVLDGAPEEARQRIRQLAERRAKLARQQARLNAKRAARSGRLDTADWWYRREMDLLGRDRPVRGAHEDVLDRMNALYRERRLDVSVEENGEDFAQPQEALAYRGLVRALAIDPASAATKQRAEKLLGDFPQSSAADEAMATLAVHDRLSGAIWRNPSLRALDASGDSVWAAKAAAYRDRPDFDPEEAFDHAAATYRRRLWRYIATGENPYREERHLTAEQTRLRALTPVRAARSLFVFDVISRALTLPFLSPIPRDELFDALNNAPTGWLETDEGRHWMEEVAESYADVRRYDQAAQVYRFMDEAKDAARMETKAARALERRASETQSPLVRADLYQRLLDDYRTYPKRARVREKLEETRLDIDTVARVTRAELRAYPDLAETLAIDPKLFDGDSDNGEMDKAGVRILASSSITYEEKKSGRVVSRSISPSVKDDAVALLGAYRVLTQRQELAGESDRLPLLPLAIQGGFLPGFSLLPQLIPPPPDYREMRYYE
ncbi:MAG: hypothetical protein RLY93_01110 [Sumerlaeia bacterium]